MKKIKYIEECNKNKHGVLYKNCGGEEGEGRAAGNSG